jgi:hypothetical protein
MTHLHLRLCKKGTLKSCNWGGEFLALRQIFPIPTDVKRRALLLKSNPSQKILKSCVAAQRI